MNFNLSNQTTYRILYLKYKAYLKPFIFLILGILIFFYFTLPSIQGYLDQKSSFSEAQKNYSILNSNYNFISNINNNELDNWHKVLTYALPKDKNFSFILNAISDAEIKSGAVLGDYNFQLGNLKNDTNSKDYITIDLTILGGVKATNAFLKALNGELPLNNVVKVNIQGGNYSNLSVSFYYALLNKIAFNPDILLLPLTNGDLKLIRNLKVFSTNFYNTAN